MLIDQQRRHLRMHAKHLIHWIAVQAPARIFQHFPQLLVH